MRADKKTETPKQQPKTKAPDSLIEITKRGDTELTEQELKRAGGGIDWGDGTKIRGGVGRVL
jgi:hypothetical protein